MIILGVIVLTFQVDINLYQRQMEFVHTAAEEAAATAALELVMGDDGASEVTQTFANGFIKFKENEAANAGLQIVNKNLSLDNAFLSTNSYFSEEMKVIIFLFNENGTYSKYENGVKTVSGATFTYGNNLSTYCSSPYTEKIAALTGSQAIYINYPSTVCIIDAGKPRFRDSFGLQSISKNIVEIGVYEYKHYK